MRNHGGPGHHWNQAEAASIRDELADSYRRLRSTTDGRTDAGSARIRGVLDSTLRSVEAVAPMWLTENCTDLLRGEVPVPTDGDDLPALGHRGLVLLEKSLSLTILGTAGPQGLAPIDGLLWWPASVVGEELIDDDEGPQMLMVHVLSEETTALTSPWPPSIWADARLTDLGMFALPLGVEFAPPTEAADDLAPAIELLLGLGAALRDGRLIFEAIGGETRSGPAPRTVAVVVPT